MSGSFDDEELRIKARIDTSEVESDGRKLVDLLEMIERKAEQATKSVKAATSPAARRARSGIDIEKAEMAQRGRQIQEIEKLRRQDVLSAERAAKAEQAAVVASLKAQERQRRESARIAAALWRDQAQEAARAAAAEERAFREAIDSENRQRREAARIAAALLRDQDRERRRLADEARRAAAGGAPPGGGGAPPGGGGAPDGSPPGGSPSAGADGFDQLAGSLVRMATATAVLYAAFKILELGIREAAEAAAAFIETGLSFNQKLETSKRSIAALVATFYEFKDASGRVLSGGEALDAAFTTSTRIIEELRVAAAKTPLTFDELLGALQQVAANAGHAGVRLEELVPLTTNLAGAVRVLGLDARQVQQEIRSLLTGDRGPDATLLNLLNITQKQSEEWRKQGTYVEEVNKRLLFFNLTAARAAGNMDVLVSNLSDTYDLLAQQATEQTFGRVKEMVARLAEGLLDPINARLRPEIQSIVDFIDDALFTIAGHGLRLEGDLVAGLQDFGRWLGSNRNLMLGVVDSTVELVRQVFLVGDAVNQLHYGLSGTSKAQVQNIQEAGNFASAIHSVALGVASLRDFLEDIGRVLLIITQGARLLVEVIIVAALTRVQAIVGYIGILNDAVAEVSRRAAADLAAVEAARSRLGEADNTREAHNRINQAAVDRANERAAAAARANQGAGDPNRSRSKPPPPDADAGKKAADERARAMAAATAEVLQLTRATEDLRRQTSAFSNVEAAEINVAMRKYALALANAQHAQAAFNQRPAGLPAADIAELEAGLDGARQAADAAGRSLAALAANVGDAGKAGANAEFARVLEGIDVEESRAKADAAVQFAKAGAERIAAVQAEIDRRADAERIAAFLAYVGQVQRIKAGLAGESTKLRQGFEDVGAVLSESAQLELRLTRERVEYHARLLEQYGAENQAQIDSLKKSFKQLQILQLMVETLRQMAPLVAEIQNLEVAQNLQNLPGGIKPPQAPGAPNVPIPNAPDAPKVTQSLRDMTTAAFEAAGGWAYLGQSAGAALAGMITGSLTVGQGLKQFFFGLIGDLAIQFGTLALLAGTVANAMPWFGLVGIPAIIAGTALIAFGTLMKGLAGGGGGTATGAAPVAGGAPSALSNVTSIDEGRRRRQVRGGEFLTSGESTERRPLGFFGSSGGAARVEITLKGGDRISQDLIDGGFVTVDNAEGRGLVTVRGLNRGSQRKMVKRKLAS